MGVGIVNKEELIFNIHKNDIIEDTIRYKKDLTKKYGISDNEAHDLFARIVNFQIDAYGYQMQKFNDYVSKDDYYRRNRTSLQRAYERTRG
jgi:hypothetical protein